jgi:hypothetical protein
MQPLTLGESGPVMFAGFSALLRHGRPLTDSYKRWLRGRFRCVYDGVPRCALAPISGTQARCGAAATPPLVGGSIAARPRVCS